MGQQDGQGTLDSGSVIRMNGLLLRRLTLDALQFKCHFFSARKEKIHMKIAMIGHKDFPSRSGGVEVFVGGLSTSLVKRGYRPRAMTSV